MTYFTNLNVQTIACLINNVLNKENYIFKNNVTWRFLIKRPQYYNTACVCSYTIILYYCELTKANVFIFRPISLRMRAMQFLGISDFQRLR